MRIALAQISSGRDLQTNLRLVDDQVAAAAASDAEIVVFPEATMRGFGHRLTDIAEPLDGPWADGIRAIADRHGVTVAVGMFTPAAEGDDGPRVANTLFVTGTDVDASYDKIHLFDAFGFQESSTVAPGEEAVIVDIAGVRFGLAICYDVRFPQLFQRLAAAGAQAVILVASWQPGPGKVDQWQTLVRARAMDATLWMLACDQAFVASDGERSAPTGVGHSMVVDPFGTVLESLDEAPGLLLWDLDVSELESHRRRMPVLANAQEFRISRS